MQVFQNQPWRKMRASLILSFGKNKSLVWKGRRQEKTAFLYMLLVENERETSELNRGLCFSMESKATCKNRAHSDG